MVSMDIISSKLLEIEWRWADKDPVALELLEERIAKAGRDLSLITYSDLVRGIKFNVSSLHDGKMFEIRIHEWTELDRALIGDFLGLISSRSYERAKFMASALVVSKGEYRPSPHFFSWMETLDVLPNLEDDTVLAFWASEVNTAHKWFTTHRR
jgi:hypothetical protein